MIGIGLFAIIDLSVTSSSAAAAVTTDVGIYGRLKPPNPPYTIKIEDTIKTNEEGRWGQLFVLILTVVIPNILIVMPMLAVLEMISTIFGYIYSPTLLEDIFNGLSNGTAIF